MRSASENSETGGKQNSDDRRAEMEEYQRNLALDAAEITIRLGPQEKKKEEASEEAEPPEEQRKSEDEDSTNRKSQKSQLELEQESLQEGEKEDMRSVESHMTAITARTKQTKQSAHTKESERRRSREQKDGNIRGRRGGEKEPNANRI